MNLYNHYPYLLDTKSTCKFSKRCTARSSSLKIEAQISFHGYVLYLNRWCANRAHIFSMKTTQLKRSSFCAKDRLVLYCHSEGILCMLKLRMEMILVILILWKHHWSLKGRWVISMQSSIQWMEDNRWKGLSLSNLLPTQN